MQAGIFWANPEFLRDLKVSIAVHRRRLAHDQESTHGKLATGRFCLSIRLDAESFAFVQRFMAAGVFESHDEMIAAALRALASAIETSARRAAVGLGCPGAEEASLEELADMLGRSERSGNH